MKLFIWFGVIQMLFSCCSTHQNDLANQRPVKIIAHRGVHQIYPENSLAAIQEAIRLELDYVEIDVRMTADSHLVLMHNLTIDKMTRHTGKISELTLNQLKALWLVDQNDSLTREKIPLFSEALEIMRGKIGIYVDLKTDDPAAVIAELDRFEMLESAVIYAGPEQFFEIKKINPSVKIMPEIENEKVFEAAMQIFQPQIVAMSWDNFSDSLIQNIHNAGIPIFMDILGEGDNPDGVRKALAAGLEGIQTDDPVMVLQTLKHENKTTLIK
ncbi:glycerophosphodiester phosphodiesterase family protein [candidate division KSB1 bacterium]|nr:glycerophosphodiester phosphodiesterase family protein [candidate division KSB1 bacterium]